MAVGTGRNGSGKLIHEQLLERRAENDLNEKWENKRVTHAEPRRDTCNIIIIKIEMVYTEKKEMRWSVENEIILWIMWKSWCWDLEEIEIWQRNLAKKVHVHVCKSFTLF